jgi:hypothetical protein
MYRATVYDAGRKNGDAAIGWAVRADTTSMQCRHWRRKDAGDRRQIRLTIRQIVPRYGKLMKRTVAGPGDWAVHSSVGRNFRTGLTVGSQFCQRSNNSIEFR